MILDLSVAANASLARLPALSRWGLLDFDAERRLAYEFVARLGVKTPSIDALVGQLSGGNQQKVALARWLATNPSLLILDEPTQGIDVGSKAEIHRLMCDLAARGLAILMISSDLPEVLGMSDRIAVMHAGTIAGEIARADATQESVLELALGHVTLGHVATGASSENLTPPADTILPSPLAGEGSGVRGERRRSMTLSDTRTTGASRGQCHATREVPSPLGRVRVRASWKTHGPHPEGEGGVDPLGGGWSKLTIMISVMFRWFVLLILHYCTRFVAAAAGFIPVERMILHMRGAK